MTDKQLAANRRNSLKSTGPKTATGKARSSQNSLKHGVLAEAPFLKGVESRKAWEEHRDGLFKSLAPVGYFEELLTLQLAKLSWRLSRITRFEAKVAVSGVAVAEIDFEERRAKAGSGKPSDPAQQRAKADQSFRVATMLEALPTMPDEEKLDDYVASAALSVLSAQVPDDAGFISVPGIPDDDPEFNAFDNWTADLLRKAVELHAAAAGMTPDALRKQCVISAHETRDSALESERRLVELGQRWELLLEQGK